MKKGRNMRKFLLLDTAFAAMPIYEYLIRQEDSEVWVMGNRSSDALALMAGNKWIKQDYSVVEEVKKYIQNYGFEYVIPGCTDVSIETCLKLDLNVQAFDSFETYRKLGNKSEFRKLCELLKLPSPKVIDIKDFPKSGKFICKPVDAFSGNGVAIVDGEDTDKLKQAYKTAVNESRTKKAIIEEYVEGQLYSFSAFIEECKVQDFFIVKEGSSVNPYAVDTSYVDNSFEESVIGTLKESIEKLSGHLKLKNGLLHTQFILSNNVPYIIELSRRAPGDLYSYLIESSTGFEYAAKYASYYINKHQPSLRKYTKHIIRHTIAAKETTRFLNLKLIAKIQMYAYFPLLSLGNKVEKDQKTRVGIMFTESPSYDALLSDYDQYIMHQVYILDQLK